VLSFISVKVVFKDFVTRQQICVLHVLIKEIVFVVRGNDLLFYLFLNFG
jgi:hypothetical protein